MSSSAEELLFGSQSQSISTKQSSAEQMLFGKPEEQTIGSFQ